MDKEHMESNEQQTEVAATQVQEVKVNKVNVLGLVGFILSIISLFLSVFGVVPLAALVLSIVGLVQCTKRGGGMKGFPIAGIIIGAVSFGYAIYMLIALL